VFDEDKYTMEENKIRFEQEIAIMWGISSHPNIITLVGYSEDPRCIITKVIFSFFLFFSLFFWSIRNVESQKINEINSYTKQIYLL